MASENASATAGAERRAPGGGAAGRIASGPRFRRTSALMPAGPAVLLVCLAWGPLVRAGDPLDQRREEIQRMDPAEKARLEQNYERFTDLDPAEQARIRRLHENIEAAPNTKELRQVMDRYYEWLKTLSPYVRAELKDLPLEARIQRISEFRQQEKEREAARAQYLNTPRGERFKQALRDANGRPLSEKDIEGLFAWIEEVGPRYRTRFLESMPEARRQQWREALEKVKDPKGQHEFFGQMWVRWLMDHKGALPPGIDQELASLPDKLSEPTRDGLQAMSEDQRRQAVAKWIRLLVMQEFAIRRAGLRLPVVSDEELADFLEKEIEPSRRAWLLGLPADDMQRQLTYMYMRSKMQDDSFILPGWGGTRGVFGPGRGGSGSGGRRPAMGPLGRGGRPGPGRPGGAHNGPPPNGRHSPPGGPHPAAP